MKFGTRRIWCCKTLVASAALLAVLLAQPALADLRQWVGPTTNNLWTNPNNWNPNIVPVAGDDVKVISVGSQTVSYNTNINPPGYNSLIVSATGSEVYS